MSQYSILKNEWLKWIDGPNNEQGNHNHIDKDGNIYMCGFSTSSNVSINNPNGTLITYTGPNVASTSFADYLVKFNPSGTVLWFKWINGTGDDRCFKTITTDTDGYVYYSGYTTSQSITIANTQGTLNTFTGGSSTGNQDIFIMKLSSDGNTVSWVKWLTSTGTGASDFGTFLKIDSLNNLYLCGFTNTTSITYNGITYSGGTSTTTNSGFLLKIDTSVSGAGAALWFKWITAIGSSNINVYALDIDANDNVIVGCWGTAQNLTIGGVGYSNVGPASGRAETTFIIKFDADGVVQWVKSINGNSNDYIFTLTIMQSDDICISGFTNSNTLLIGGINYSGKPSLGMAMYICILNTEGIPTAFKWLDGTSTNTSDEQSFSIKCDYRDNLYLVGSTSSTSITIDGTVYTRAATGIDGFILKLNSSLVSTWFKWITGTGSENTYGISLNNTNNPDIYITGYNTSGNLTLQGTVYTRPTTGEGAFLLKLSQFEPIVLQYSNIYANEVIMLPIKSITGTIQVNWGDGSAISNITTNNPTHTYISPREGINVTTIQIYSANPTLTNYFTHFGISSVNEDITNITKLTNLIQFGSFPLTSLKGAFLSSSLASIDISYGNTNPLTVTDMSYMFYAAADFNQSLNFLTITNVTDMSYMFSQANSFNSGIPLNTSNVTNMYYMFGDTAAFNQPINDLVTTSVTNMSCMFCNTTAFNQPLNNWNVSNVTNMSNMFNRALAFNQPLNSWNVSNVATMISMFLEAIIFNQPLNSWNVSNVNDMSYMFYTAYQFNQPLNNWNVSSITTMSNMFYYATNFNQNLSSWNVSNVSDMTSMFDNSGLSNVNYTYTLIGWRALPSLQSFIPLGAASKQYFTDAVSARSYLTTTKFWSINDGGALTDSINPRYGSPFRYYKWFIYGLLSNLTVQASEFIFYDYYKVPIPLTSFTITSDEDSQSGYEPSKLIDNNFFSKWVSNGGNFNCSLILDLGVNYITVQKPYYYSWITADNFTFGFTYEDPYFWKLYGSNNSTIWFLLSEQTSYYVGTSTRNTETTLSVDGENYFTISYPPTSPLQLKYTALSSSLTITLPLSGTVNVAVNWGDTKYNAYTTSGEKTHTYSTAGTYTVEIDGTLTQFGLGASTYPYVSRLTEVVSFGEIGLTSLSGAFNGATNLLYVPASLPIKSSITDLSYTFKGAIILGGSTEDDKDYNITKWNVVSVSNMAYLFSGCLSFNQDVSKWFLYKVTNMSHMFSGCSSFNKNISNWNVSSATDMSYILADCSSFNQDLSNWNISNVADMDHFFHQTPISRTNYDNMLIAWSNSNPQNTVSTFYADLTKYSYGNPSLARYKLSVSPYQWSITDLGIETTTLSTPMSLEYRVVAGNLTITLPLYGIVDVFINWGDSITLYPYTTTGDKTHTYSTIGTYTVLIYNRLTQFGNGSTSYANADRLYTVNSFGEISLTSLSGAFYGATNLTQVPTSLPTSSTITNLSYTFKNATLFNQDISNWTISSITTMENMFDGVTLSTVNYDLLLNAWVLLSLKKNVLFNAGSSKYSYGLATIARNKITNINNYNWTILDGGQDATTIPASAMVLVYTVSSSKTITLPLNTLNSFPINVSVDWGDSITDTYTTIGDKTHTYSTAGDYLVKITGTLIQFGNGATGYTNPEKLVRVLSFGNIGITSLSGAFYGCSNLIEIPSSISSSITNLDYAFYNCLTLNDINITYWDMTNVINIDYMLYNAQSFDQNIFVWNVPKLTDFRFLLYQAKAFKQPISGWLSTYLNLFPLTPP
jgi:surface protein